MTGCNVFLTDSGLRIYIIVTEKNQVVSVSGSFFIKKSAGVRLYEVIAVYKPDIFSMGMGKTVICRLPSVLPSLTATISISSSVCANKLSRHALRYFSTLYTGKMMLTLKDFIKNSLPHS